MSGMSWPGDLGLFKDVADKFFSDADESGLKTAAENHKTNLGVLQSALEDADKGYGDLADGFNVEGKGSDMLGVVQKRRAEFRRKAGALAAKARAGQEFMEVAAPVIVDSKTKDQRAGYAARDVIQQAQYWPDWMMSAAGVQTNMEKAKQQLEQQMSTNMSDRVGKLQGKYKAPAEGDYGFDGKPTTWDNGGGMVSSSSARQGQGASSGGGMKASAESHQQQAASLDGMKTNSVARQQQNTSENSGMKSSAESSSSQAPASADQGSGSSGGGSGAEGGSGSAGGNQSGSAAAPSRSNAGQTSAAHGDAAVADKISAPSPAAPAGGGGGGGMAPQPQIGGFAGGPGGGPGSQGSARISGVGTGADAPRTGVQGASQPEKPTAQPAQQSQQGPGVRSAGPVGAGAAGAGTSTQGAAPAGYNQAQRTQDSVAGAGRAADKLAGLGEQLATNTVTNLAAATARSLTAGTELMAGSAAALAGSLVARNPWHTSGIAELVAVGGTVAGPAARWGYVVGSDGVGRFGRAWDVGSYVCAGLGYLVFASEDMSVTPNEAEGITRPVRTEITSNENWGNIRPEFEVPDGMGVMARGEDSGAPKNSGGMYQPGPLAVALAKWKIGLYDSRQTPWRPVAVGFLVEPDAVSVDALSQLGVDAFWPGRAGFNPEDLVQAQMSRGVEKVADSDAKLKRTDPLAHAQAAAQQNPKGEYDPAGLPEPQAGWYVERAKLVQQQRLSNRDWLVELQEHKRLAEGGGELNLNF